MGELVERGVRFASGVPDSSMPGLVPHLRLMLGESRCLVAANEGVSVAQACGFFMATGELGCVYMQNSGLGNAVNPLASLANPHAYGIPTLLIVGLRGESGLNDEPQHELMGHATIPILEALEIPYIYLTKGLAQSEILMAIDEAIGKATKESRPTALLVSPKLLTNKSDVESMLNRADNSALVTTSIETDVAFDWIKRITDPTTSLFLSTGFTARQYLEHTKFSTFSGARAFLNVGAMGHIAGLAGGFWAGGNPDHRIVLVDGDGALIMHLGSLATICDLIPKRFIHIVLNNKMHESVGGQPTPTKNVNFGFLFRAVGYRFFGPFSHSESLYLDTEKILDASLSQPVAIEILTGKRSRHDFSRPSRNLNALLKKFMQS